LAKEVGDTAGGVALEGFEGLGRDRERKAIGLFVGHMFQGIQSILMHNIFEGHNVQETQFLHKIMVLDTIDASIHGKDGNLKILDLLHQFLRRRRIDTAGEDTDKGRNIGGATGKRFPGLSGYEKGDTHTVLFLGLLKNRGVLDLLKPDVLNDLILAQHFEGLVRVGALAIVIHGNIHTTNRLFDRRLESFTNHHRSGGGGGSRSGATGNHAVGGALAEVKGGTALAVGGVNIIVPYSIVIVGESLIAKVIVLLGKRNVLHAGHDGRDRGSDQTINVVVFQLLVHIIGLYKGTRTVIRRGHVVFICS